MIDIKQNSSSDPLVFNLVQTDGVTPLTGATPVVTISKAGGVLATPAGAVSEIGGGGYKVAGNSTDTNTLGLLWVHITVSGGNAQEAWYNVVAYDPKSAVDLGLSAFSTILAAISSSSTIATAVWAAGTRSLTDKANFTLSAAYDAAKAAASEANATLNKQAILDWLGTNMPTLVQIAGAITTAVSGLATTLQLTSAKEEILDAVGEIDGGGGGGGLIDGYTDDGRAATLDILSQQGIGVYSSTIKTPKGWLAQITAGDDCLVSNKHALGGFAVPDASLVGTTAVMAIKSTGNPDFVTGSVVVASADQTLWFEVLKAVTSTLVAADGTFVVRFTDVSGNVSTWIINGAVKIYPRIG